MIELLAVAIAFVGSCAAAAWDLKTTEIPDEIPYAMAAVGLLLAAVLSILQWSYWPIAVSVAVGCCLLGFGFLMYYFGQWGGGDVKLLAAIGFLLPQLPAGFAPKFWFGLPFPLSYLFNVFFIGVAYMLLYAFVFALLNRKVFVHFANDVKASASVLLIGSIVLFVAFFGLNFYFLTIFPFGSGVASAMYGLDTAMLLRNSLLPLLITIGLFFVWKFAHAVEDVGFKKKIPMSMLRVGDILLESKELDGITEQQLRKLKRSGKRHVWIKEGVRFGPTFPIALLFTLYVGDALMIVFNFI